MSGWKVKVIPAAQKEIKALSNEMQARFLHVAELIEALGPQRVGEPHVKHLEGKLWEMRMGDRDGIARAIYFAAKGRQILVVRAFVKKTQKTPRREIDLAAQRMKGL